MSNNPQSFSTLLYRTAYCIVLFAIMMACSSDSDLLSEEIIGSQKEDVPEDEPEQAPSQETEIRESLFQSLNDAYIQDGEGYNRQIVRLKNQVRTSYLMFDLSPIHALAGKILSAELSFTVTNESGYGAINIYKGDTQPWTENNLSEINRPDTTNLVAHLDKKYRLDSVQRISLDTTLIKSEKLTLIITHENGTGFSFASKEHKGIDGPLLKTVYETDLDAPPIEIPEVPGAKPETNNPSPPIAIANASVTSGVAPLTVVFSSENSSSSFPLTNFSWNFKDGHLSSGTETTHVFENGGEFPVALTITDEKGYHDTDYVTINVTAPENQGPTAVATASATSGPAPLTVTFSAEGSTDDKGITEHLWQLDPETSVEAQDAEHTFEQPGTYQVTLTVTDEKGLKDTKTITIIVGEPENQAPTAVATASATSGPAPLTVTFSAEGSTDDKGITEHLWQLDPETSAEAQDTEHTFEQPGTYQVTLTVTDEKGLKDTKTITIIVGEPENQAPTAVATASATSGPAPLTVTFSAEGSTDDKGITEHLWQLDPETSAEAQDTEHTFEQPGTYQVTLTVTDEKGLKDTKTITIIVGEPENQAPTAVATASATSGPAPLTVTFSAEGSTDDKGITEHLWQLDPETRAEAQDTEHTFEQPGTYQVTLTVTDEKGLKDTKTITITVEEPENQAPTAVATASATSGPAPLTVTFSAEGSTDDKGITEHLWQLDPETSVEAQDAEHTFEQPGTYQVTLTVTDEKGLKDTKTITIIVGEPENQAPTAVATASATSGPAPLTVTFSAEGSTDDKGITEHLWQLDPETSAEAQDTEHTFEQPGTYQVTLTVTDEKGLKDTKTITITVEEPENQAPTAVATASASSGPAPLMVKFTGSSSTDDSKIASYYWNFPDDPSSQADPTRTFENPGTYEISLTVTDEAGEKDTQTITITVEEPENQGPTAVATASTSSGPAPLVVKFTGSSSTDDNKIASYYWNFPDDPSSQADPTRTFENPGTYEISLTVTDEEGEKDTQTITITVEESENEAPIAVAKASITTGQAPLLVQFTGSNSTDDTKIATYYWDFPDAPSSQADPSYTFTDPGTYNITLTVTDEEGKKGSATIPITVIGAPLTTAENEFFVTTNGNSSNNGKSESQAWSLSHAFQVAKPGDIIHVKAGDYGNQQLTAYQSGYSTKKISFIGYQNNPRDIGSTVGSTFTYGEHVDDSKMPLLIGHGRNTAINLYGRHITVENFQIYGYEKAIITSQSSSSIYLKNIIAIDLGNQNSSGYDGFGIIVHGDNSLIENCYVENATAEAIKLLGADNSKISNCEVRSDNNHNPTDYYFLLAGVSHSTIENSYAERALGLSHGGHGFTVKDYGEYNFIRNCTAKHTSFELNFSGVKYNTFENCQLIGSGQNPSEWQSRLAIFNGANNNTIKNFRIDNTWAAISWTDYDDGYVGPGGDRDAVHCGHDNTFDGVIISNTNRVLNVGQGDKSKAPSERNTFINSTFSNFGSIATVFTPTEDIVFQNSSFSNGDRGVIEMVSDASPYADADFSFPGCTWSNIKFSQPK